MSVLSDDDLLKLVIYIIEYPDYYYKECNWFANDIAVSGCRSNELFAVERWSFGTDGELILSPFKGNNSRIFDPSEFSENFTNAVFNQIKPYTILTLRQLMYQINRVNAYGQLYVETKPIDAYLFRYNRVKLYYDDGYTKTEIQSFFGWTNLSMVDTYLNAVIEYN